MLALTVTYRSEGDLAAHLDERDQQGMLFLRFRELRCLTRTGRARASVKRIIIEQVDGGRRR